MRLTWILIIGIVAALSLPEEARGQTHEERREEIVQGARLWSTTCNRCHNVRSPMERPDDEWKVIVSHMRTRANLAKSEAEAIIAFLQASNEGRESEEEEQQNEETSAPSKADTTQGAQIMNSSNEEQ